MSYIKQYSRITISMYEKGRSVIMAGGLVKAYEGHRFVYLHLLCQGFENIGKSMLLANDYQKYSPQLQRVYHHNLNVLLTELQVIYGQNVLSQAAALELSALNKFYKQQHLRYGDEQDFSISVSKLSAENLHSELVALVGTWNQRFSHS